MQKLDNDDVFLKKKPENDIPFATNNFKETKLAFTAPSNPNAGMNWKPIQKTAQ